MKNLLLIFSFVFILFSCKKDDDFTTTNPEPEPQQITDEEFASENFGDVITTNFIGRIVNQEGRQLKDVTITIGNSTTSTDHNGIFVLNNASVFDKFAFVKAEKEGYIKGSRVVVPTPNGTNDIQITLLEKNIIDTVTSGETSNVLLPNGSNVEFQGEFIDSSGNSYSGLVEVSIHYLQPNNEDTFTQMPGNLFGMREDGSASGMETYGMLAINLFSPSGEQLNIDSEFPSTLTFPVDASTPNAPTEIPLWYFDEEQGFWKEEGKATRVGNEYAAEVTHFSWWNIDIPFEAVKVCFTLRSRELLANFYIEIIRDESNQSIFSGYTNDVGHKCVLQPKNEIVTINIFSKCSNIIIHSEQIGPYSSDTNIEIIIPNLHSELKETIFTGSITTCTGSPVTNGYLYIFDDDNNYNILNITSQNIEMPFIYCDANDYNFIIYDLDSNQSSGVTDVLLQESETNLGNVYVCGFPTGGSYNDNYIVLENQDDVNAFGLLGYTSVNTLVIGELESSTVMTDITTLVPLVGLKYIDKISINNTFIFNLNGLENVEGNTYSIDGTSLGSINRNPNLLSLSPLQNFLNPTTNLYLIENSSIINLEGLNNLNGTGQVNIYGNSSLESLDGLENFYSHSSGYSWRFTNNVRLSDFCALQNSIGWNVGIDFNLYNPTFQDILDGNCSL